MGPPECMHSIADARARWPPWSAVIVILAAAALPIASGFEIGSRYVGVCTGKGRWAVEITIFEGTGSATGWTECGGTDEAFSGEEVSACTHFDTGPSVRDCGFQHQGTGDAYCFVQVDADPPPTANFRGDARCYDPIDPAGVRVPFSVLRV